jgi:hypothetical protein
MDHVRAFEVERAASAVADLGVNLFECFTGGSGIGGDFQADPFDAQGA